MEVDVIKVLKGKNRCLQRFLELTESFVTRPPQEALAELGDFERERDAILKAADLYDRKAVELAQAMPVAARNAEFQSALADVFAEKERITRTILELDERVLALIEAERAQLLKSIVSTQKSADTMKKFKSTWVAGSGEGIDRKL